MTTESKQAPATSGSGVLLGSAVIALVAVLLLAVVAAVTTGWTGLAATLLGGGVAVAAFLSGSLVVNTVAGIAPALSLLFALTTYLVQVLALGLFFAVIGDSGLIGPTLHAGWLGGAIIVVTMVWLSAQVALFSRARIPVYDLAPQAVER